MSSQTISRAVVWTLAVVALILSVGVAAVGVIFTTAGLAGMGSLLTVGSLFLFMVIGFVTGALAATSIRFMACSATSASHKPVTGSCSTRETQGVAPRLCVLCCDSSDTACGLLAHSPSETACELLAHFQSWRTRYSCFWAHFWDLLSAHSAPALPSCPLCACLVVLPDRRSLHPTWRCSCSGTAPRGDARWSLHLDSDRRSWLYRDLLAVRTISAVCRGTIATPRDCNEFLTKSKLMVALSCRTRRTQDRDTCKNRTEGKQAKSVYQLPSRISCDADISSDK